MKKGPTHAERVVIDTDKRRLKTGSAKRPVRHTRVGRSQPRQLRPPWRVVHVVSRTDGCVPPTPPSHRHPPPLIAPVPIQVPSITRSTPPRNRPKARGRTAPMSVALTVARRPHGFGLTWAPPLGLGPLCASDLKSDALPRRRRFLHRTPGVLPGLDIGGGGGTRGRRRDHRTKNLPPPPPFPARNGCHHRPASCVTPAVRAVLIPAVIPSVIAPTGHTHTRRGKADGPRHPSTQRARAHAGYPVHRAKPMRRRRGEQWGHKTASGNDSHHARFPPCQAAPAVGWH